MKKFWISVVVICLTVVVNLAIAADPITKFARQAEDTVVALKRVAEDKERPVTGCDKVKRVVDRRVEDASRKIQRFSNDWLN